VKGRKGASPRQVYQPGRRLCEREVSAVYGFDTERDRFALAYGADYPLIEPDDEEEEEFSKTEEEKS
jgi:hypothetical protein